MAGSTRDYEQVCGGERIVVKADQITTAKARELRAAIKEVAKSYDKDLEELNPKVLQGCRRGL